MIIFRNFLLIHNVLVFIHTSCMLYNWLLLSKDMWVHTNTHAESCQGGVSNGISIFQPIMLIVLTPNQNALIGVVISANHHNG